MNTDKKHLAATLASRSAAFAALLFLAPTTAFAADVDGSNLAYVLSLRDYNTRMVVLGTTVLGFAAGVIGTFMLLRKRALLADAVSHATLPGIAMAFMLMAAAGLGGGKALPGLLAGAAVFGVLGMLSVMAIRRWTRLKDDAALGVVLSVYFGLGTVLLKLASQLPSASAAGLDRFIYGKAATMIGSDALMMLIAAAVVSVVCLLLFKEFAMVCFDQGYAAAQGWPVAAIDVAMMAVAVAVTVIGLQAVGLVLVVAMLIIPPAAARFWTDRLVWMTLIAAIVGMLSGYLGALISGLVSQASTGPVVVLVAGALFALSMLFGLRRGLLVRLATRLRLRQRIGMQHLLRAMYERHEALGEAHPITTPELLRGRAWSRPRLDKLLRQARRRGWIEQTREDHWRLTALGLQEARQVVRNHRLWELYLITHADIAPSRVDRDADDIEHVLGRPMVQQLEALLAQRNGARVPPSPHEIGDVPSSEFRVPS